jgi:hypothetical protein
LGVGKNLCQILCGFRLRPDKPFRTRLLFYNAPRCSLFVQIDDGRSTGHACHSLTNDLFGFVQTQAPKPAPGKRRHADFVGERRVTTPQSERPKTFLVVACRTEWKMHKNAEHGNETGCSFSRRRDQRIYSGKSATRLSALQAGAAPLCQQMRKAKNVTN